MAACSSNFALEFSGSSLEPIYRDGDTIFVSPGAGIRRGDRDMGWIILGIAGLSFLGLGAQPPTPEWGAMLNDSRSYMQTSPTLLLAPGVAIFLLVLGFNLLGDGLRDMLDPTTYR